MDDNTTAIYSDLMCDFSKFRSMVVDDPLNLRVAIKFVWAYLNMDDDLSSYESDLYDSLTAFAKRKALQGGL